MPSESPESTAVDLIPLAEDSDPEEVATALETALALGARGDLREALRWLRRASEAADDAGREQRSLALARTAADLATLISTQPPAEPRPTTITPPPPTAQPAPDGSGDETQSFALVNPASQSVRPLPPSARRSSMPAPPPKPGATPAAPEVAAAPDPAPSAPALAAAPSVTPQPPVTGATQGARPAKPGSSVKPAKPKASIRPSPAQAVGSSAAPGAPAAREARTSVSPRAPSVIPPAVAAKSVIPPVATTRSVPPGASRPPPKPSFSTPQAVLGAEGSQVIERLMREGRAETVSIKRSSRDPSLFVARNGAQRTHGTHRALIILLEDVPDFFNGEQPEATP